jgi:hypothetical protein
MQHEIRRTHHLRQPFGCRALAFSNTNPPPRTIARPADKCGAVKLFVAVAGIRSDAFRFSAIRWCCDSGCRFTAITRVQIPSGTPNRFRSLRSVSPKLRGCKRPRFCVSFAPSNRIASSYASPIISQPSCKSGGETKSESTAACAARFAGPTACVYTSSVERREECLINSCMTLNSTPRLLRSVQYAWRNVCHPMRF